MYQEAGVDYTEVQPTDRVRLRWRARRGLLENDLIIERFFSRFGDTLTDAQVQGLSGLLTFSDNDLLDLLLSRKELDAPLKARPEALVLEQLRATTCFPLS